MRKILFFIFISVLAFTCFSWKKYLGLLFSSFDVDYVLLPFAAELLGLPAVGYWAFSFASGPQV
jgi:hypothetical protein